MMGGALNGLMLTVNERTFIVVVPHGTDEYDIYIDLGNEGRKLVGKLPNTATYKEIKSICEDYKK